MRGFLPLVWVGEEGAPWTAAILLNRLGVWLKKSSGTRGVPGKLRLAAWFRAQCHLKSGCGPAYIRDMCTCHISHLASSSSALASAAKYTCIATYNIEATTLPGYPIAPLNLLTTASYCRMKSFQTLSSTYLKRRAAGAVFCAGSFRVWLSIIFTSLVGYRAIWELESQIAVTVLEEGRGVIIPSSIRQIAHWRELRRYTYRKKRDARRDFHNLARAITSYSSIRPFNSPEIRYRSVDEGHWAALVAILTCPCPQIFNKLHSRGTTNNHGLRRVSFA
jgi:hypothetical protein